MTGAISRTITRPLTRVSDLTKALAHNLLQLRRTPERSWSKALLGLEPGLHDKKKEPADATAGSVRMTVRS
jgi:hypothetical protein